VVTNHAMLGLQAAHGIPTVIDAKTVGPVHTVIVDECYALPATVRSQGGNQVSGPRLARLVDTVGRLASGHDPDAAQLAADGHTLAARIGAELVDYTARQAAGQQQSGTPKRSVSGPPRLADGDDPLAGCGDQIETWLSAAGKTISQVLRAQPDGSAAELRLRRCVTRITGFADAVRYHNPLFARWLETQQHDSCDTTVVVEAAPVQVAPMLAPECVDCPTPGRHGRRC
jgi:hypothetical protein